MIEQGGVPKFTREGMPWIPAVAVGAIKGGDGKSTYTNLIVKMLAHRGLRVLVIDMDPQHTITIYLMGEERTYSKEVRERNIVDAMAKGDLAPYIHPVTDNIHIVPGTFSLVKMRSMPQTSLEQALFKFCEGHAGEYDIIIMDTPGTWDNLVENAYVASDLIISPVNATDKGSYFATELSRQQIKECFRQKGIAKWNIAMNLWKDNQANQEIAAGLMGLTDNVVPTFIPNTPLIPSLKKKEDWPKPEPKYKAVYAPFRENLEYILEKLGVEGFAEPEGPLSRANEEQENEEVVNG